MIMESILSTIVGEWLRSKLPKRKIKNNIPNIKVIESEMPSCATVGELRELLSNFSDDTKLGGGFGYPLLQPFVIGDEGHLMIGSATTHEPSKLISKN